jgi:hypothetical protein
MAKTFTLRTSLSVSRCMHEWMLADEAPTILFLPYSCLCMMCLTTHVISVSWHRRDPLIYPDIAVAASDYLAYQMMNNMTRERYTEMPATAQRLIQQVIHCQTYSFTHECLCSRCPGYWLSTRHWTRMWNRLEKYKSAFSIWNRSLMNWTDTRYNWVGEVMGRHARGITHYSLIS